MSRSQISVQADDGGAFSAHIATPPGGVGPGLLVLPEIFNSNDHIRSVADGFAAQGYVTLAPDVFWRLEPDTYLPYTDDGRTKARALNAELHVDRLVEDLGRCVTALKARPECTGLVGATGFCLGGKLAFLCAARLGVDAAVSYYGVKIDAYLEEAEQIKCPMIFHFAENDSHVPPDAVAAVKDRMGARPDVEIFVYPGTEHGFNRAGYPPHHAESAAQAMRRTLGLFNRVLMPAAAAP